MSLICLIDSDSKILDQIEQLLKSDTEKNCYKILRCANIKELDKNIKAGNLQSDKIELIVVKAEQIKNISDGTLFALKVKYNTNLVLISYDDQENPFFEIENWPVENLIYKPFSNEYFKQVLRLAINPTGFIIPEGLSTKQNFAIEKIRKINISAISDFGFIMTSKSVFKVGKAYKFYNIFFAEKKNKSMWARVVRSANHQYELVFCAPKPFVISNIRRRIMAAKNRLKSVEWIGKESLDQKYSYATIIQISDKKILSKTTDFFERKFPELDVVDFNSCSFDSPKDCDLFISDQEHDSITMSKLFTKRPLFIRVAEAYIDREDAEKKLEYETLRVDKNVDRNFLGRTINCYFPKCKDEDPIIARWISCDELTLQTEVYLANNFCEAGFEYQRDTILEHGAYQEFALTELDETNIQILKAKIHHHEQEPSINGLYRHQVSFIGLKEDQQNRIRQEFKAETAENQDTKIV